MSSERPFETSSSPANRPPQPTADRADADAPDQGHVGDGGSQGATVLVRGETISPQQSGKPATPAPTKEQTKSASKPVSERKVALQSRLPQLDDDAHVGISKEQLVIRDGKADLAFTGTLLASAAPTSAPDGHWDEYRIYETDGGKRVFSKTKRSIFADEPDHHQAEVFDPSPASKPSQLLRSARNLTHSRPITWADAAVDFFGYDPLAKTMYRKLGDQFDEHIS